MMKALGRLFWVAVAAVILVGVKSVCQSWLMAVVLSLNYRATRQGAGGHLPCTHLRRRRPGRGHGDPPGRRDGADRRRERTRRPAVVLQVAAALGDRDTRMGRHYTRHVEQENRPILRHLARGSAGPKSLGDFGDRIEATGCRKDLAYARA